MTRLRRFAHNVGSGYVALGANIIFSFASVPFALHYLSRQDFGLWALLMQLVGYLGLIDLGMSGAVTRLLIDHKDEPETGDLWKHGANFAARLAGSGSRSSRRRDSPLPPFALG